MHWTVTIGDKTHAITLPDQMTSTGFDPVTIDGKTLNIRWHSRKRLLVIEQDGSQKTFPVRAANCQFFPESAQVRVEGQFLGQTAAGLQSIAAIVERATPGIDSKSNKKTNAALSIRSQISGKILKVNCEPGSSVAQGDVLLIIEAMKMENKIFAAQNGTIATIHVQPEQSVSTGDLLLTFKQTSEP